MSDLVLRYEGDEESFPLSGQAEDWRAAVSIRVRAVKRGWLQSWHRRYDLAQARERKAKRDAEKAMGLEEGALLDPTESGEAAFSALHRELLDAAVVGLDGVDTRGRSAVDAIVDSGLTTDALRVALAYQRPSADQRRLLPGPGGDGGGGA